MVVEYRYVDASYGVYGNLLVCMVVAIVAFILPVFWFFVALDVVFFFVVDFFVVVFFFVVFCFFVVFSFDLEPSATEDQFGEP